MRPITDKWVERFLNQAKDVASWSKDPSTVVGCVIVRDRATVSQGYNGFPEGVDDNPEYYEDRNRDLKYELTVHAEENAVYNAAKRGVALDGTDMFVHGLPCCSKCAKAIIQSGIRRVWMRHGPMRNKWRESFEHTKFMFRQAGVEYVCVEERSGLPGGSHRVEGSPGPGNEPIG